MIVPTQMGLVLVALGMVLYLVSLQAQSGLLFLVLGLLFGCYVINAVSAWLTTRHLHLIPPPRLAGHEGDHAREVWEIRNPSRWVLGLLEVSGPWGMLLRVGAVPAGQTVRMTPELTLPSRGVYPFRRLWVSSAYPFGLVRSYRRLPVAGEIVVYPAVYPCPAPVAAGFEPMVGGRHVGQNRSSVGDSFHGIRPAAAGDPVKLIHWPSSSKGLGLMVKEFDEELSGRVAIFVDAVDVLAPNREPLFNWAARAAASLVLSALEAGHQVELLSRGYDTDVVGVPPFAPGDTALEALARSRPCATPLSRPELAAAVRRLPQRAGLTLILMQVDDDVCKLLTDDLLPARRLLSVYLPAGTATPALPGVTLHRYGEHELWAEDPAASP